MIKLRSLLILALAALLPLPSFAQAAAPAPEMAEEAPPHPLVQDMMALLPAIREKAEAGVESPAGLSTEMAEIDAILARYPDAPANMRAEAAMMKPMIYLQLFEDFDQGAALLKSLAVDYAGTEVATQIPQMLAQIETFRAAKQAQVALAPGNLFPDFEAKDLTGAPLSVARFRGKVLLVDFWAVWCGPCVRELPNVKAAYAKYHDRGFEILGISLDQDRDRLDKFLADEKMTWPQYFDGQGWDNILADKYGIKSIPATFLLDAEGKVIARDLRGPALEAELAKLLPEA